MDFLLEAESILELVDEYTIYCRYLEHEPRIGWCYAAPYRPDGDPSWSMYNTNHSYKSYMWKDHAFGYKGDVFDLIQRMYGISSRMEVFAKVIMDFGLVEASSSGNFQKIVWVQPPPAIPIEIRVKSRPLFRPSDLLFYDQFGITTPILKRYNTTSLICHWVSSSPTPRFPRGLCFAYRIDDRYQIYQPGESKTWKFRTSFRHDENVMGMHQLKGRYKLLIITKSMKDVMFFDTLGIDAVACASENTRIPEWFFERVACKYEKVIIWMDNDGKESSATYYSNYTRVYVPIASGEKDPTDFRKRYGAYQTHHMIKDILYGQGIIFSPAT